MADIVAVAKFDSDEIAFFTKNYKAYVLDETDNSVKEVVASDLSEGDVIVFTRSTSKTRDIVEEILRDMISNRLISPEIENAYYKSREWKKTLIDYMKRTGRSAKEIADDMISNGVSVQEITIRGWLDEESHTVRPQKLDSIQQIALIAGNDELFDGAEICFDAGGQIYKLPTMSEDEMLKLLATDGMLVKRPLLVGIDFVLVGFKEAEWESHLKK